MEKHTPGPWEMPLHPYIQQSDGEGANFSDGDWEIVPPLGEAGPVAIVNSEANALLIAAAPELLEALRSLLTGLQFVQSAPRDPGGRGLLQAAVDDARKVLAKATGDAT